MAFRRRRSFRRSFRRGFAGRRRSFSRGRRVLKIGYRM